MIDNFVVFRNAVQARFAEMVKTGALFTVAVDKDALWQTYLGAFPEGSNPIYKERTEHDCTCCKQFIRGIGHVVAIENKDQITSIWDVTVPYPYQDVADALAAFVKSNTINSLFLTRELKFGSNETRQLLDDQTIRTWDHFSLNIPKSFRHRDAGGAMSVFNSARGTLLRAIKEIPLDVVDTVAELLAQGSLYRGSEFDWMPGALKDWIIESAGTNLEVYAWFKTAQVTPGTARLRNTVLGTLLVDLANGMELDAAVSAYESKVAPANYKRPTALITQGMIDKAKKEIEALGLEDALPRRYAIEQDMQAGDLLHVNRDLVWSDNVFDNLAAGAKKISDKTLSKIEEVPVADFLKNILPHAKSLEVMFDASHHNNFMSLTAPVHADAPLLFKWDNGFAWSYNGEVTDSIKEKVKRAGGKVEGDLRASLAWYNYDDLDLHAITPHGRIYFGHRKAAGGFLDVDENAGGGRTRTPVENIIFADRRSMPRGEYRFQVNNYSRRETKGVGFELEIEFGGQIMVFSYDKSLATGRTVDVAVVNYDGDRFEVKPLISAKPRQVEIWGVRSGVFTPVKMVMTSPNFWNGQEIGNKHLFFILDKCVNPDSARGFYNEFLNGKFEPHRKVFEVLGNKMRVPESADQLSGLGFSVTQRNQLLCRVAGSFNRIIKIMF